jgi:hypothetical protein
VNFHCSDLEKEEIKLFLSFPQFCDLILRRVGWSYYRHAKNCGRPCGYSLCPQEANTQVVKAGKWMYNDIKHDECIIEIWLLKLREKKIPCIPLRSHVGPLTGSRISITIRADE